MSIEQLEEGKRWVSSTLTELATSGSVEIERADWRQSVDDVRARAESLVLEARGRRFIARFPLAQLEDIPGDLGLRIGVEDYLRNLVARMTAQSGPRGPRGPHCDGSSLP